MMGLANGVIAVISSQRACWDVATVMAQLGLVPAAE